MQSNRGNATAADTERDRPDELAPARTRQARQQHRLLAELQAVRAELGVLAVREQERAAHREAVIDRLHAENQALRRGVLESLLEPVRAGLYRLYDMAGREARRWSGDERPSAEHAGALFGAIADEVREVLARTGVEPFSTRPGEPYDPVRHRPVGRVEVADTALDGTVVDVRNDGFTRADTIARRAEVVVGTPPRRQQDPSGSEG